MKDIIPILDRVTSVTGVLATILICFFPEEQMMRFIAFGLYVIANITLALLAHLKGIPVTAKRERDDLSCMFARRTLQ